MRGSVLGGGSLNPTQAKRSLVSKLNYVISGFFPIMSDLVR